jgi:hypothetical protein
VCDPLIQAFHFPSTLGEVTLHLLSQACVLVYSSCGKWVCSHLLWSFLPTTTFSSFSAPDYWAVLLLLSATMFIYNSLGKWVFSALLWSFPPSATLISFPAPGCWVCARLLMEPLQPIWLVYLQFQEGFHSLSNLWCSVCPTLFPCVFILLIAHYTVSLFSLGGGQSVQGAMLLWLRVVCGSTMYP